MSQQIDRRARRVCLDPGPGRSCRRPATRAGAHSPSLAPQALGALEIELRLLDDDEPRRLGAQRAGETVGDAGDGEPASRRAEVRRGVALHVGYNQAAGSGDAELTAARVVGPLRAMAVGRFLSNGYHSDTARYAIGGGATLRLHRWVALAGDVTTLLDKRPGEKVAWGAGLQLAIPYSPHTVSLQVTNTNTATLQGASRGIDRVRGGFEFTIPFTLSRYFGRRSESAAKNGGGEGAANATQAEIRAMKFTQERIEVAAGTTVRWTNNDQLQHSVTVNDGSWDSGLINPGGSWTHTFTQPGEYSFHCTPHPFMKGVVVVRQP